MPCVILCQAFSFELSLSILSPIVLMSGKKTGYNRLERGHLKVSLHRVAHSLSWVFIQDPLIVPSIKYSKDEGQIRCR